MSAHGRFLVLLTYVRKRTYIHTYLVNKTRSYPGNPIRHGTLWKPHQAWDVVETPSGMGLCGIPIRHGTRGHKDPLGEVGQKWSPNSTNHNKIRPFLGSSSKSDFLWYILTLRLSKSMGLGRADCQNIPLIMVYSNTLLLKMHGFREGGLLEYPINNGIF